MGVALPRILYGIEVWHPPQQKSRRGVKPPTCAATRKLTTVQREGALAITGGFRTSPTDSLNAHAALLLMHMRIERIKFAKVTCLASLPPVHPLQKQMQTAARRRVRRHRSPLHELANILQRDPGSIEEIPVVHANPALRQTIPVKVSIPADKEESIREDANAREEIKIYLDSSIQNGKVGATAVLYRNGRRKGVLKLHLGVASEHTVYEAELVGLILGLQLIKNEKKGKTNCAIGADNQAAIKALQSELTKPGQHLAAKFLRMVKQVKNSRGSSGGKYSLTVRWTAVHSGIEGNEEADGEARSMAEGNSSPDKSIPSYIRKKVKKSISALKQDCNKKLKEEWKTEWNQSERSKRFKAPDIVSPASKKYLSLISNHRILKNMSSLIFQLRVGHAPLNAYLFWFGKVDSARCPACGVACKMPDHFLLQCPKYEHERWALLRSVKDSDLKIEHILSNQKSIIPVLNYINTMEHFKIQSQEQSQNQVRPQA